MRKFNHATFQPFKKSDMVRQYHHTDMSDDFLVTFAHSNGALDVVRHGVNYGLSALFSELSPNQDASIGESKKK